MQETELITAEQFMAMGDGFRELVRGEVVEMTPPGFQHGRTGAALLRRIGNYVEDLGVGGEVVSDTGFFLARDPDTVRAPDLAFICGERLGGFDERKYVPFAPDLAVEVVSPSDSFREVEEKAGMWLGYGSRLVWVVEPELRKVFVHRPGAPREELSGDDELTGGEVLPGLAIPLFEIF